MCTSHFKARRLSTGSRGQPAGPSLGVVISSSAIHDYSQVTSVLWSAPRLSRQYDCRVWGGRPYGQRHSAAPRPPFCPAKGFIMAGIHHVTAISGKPTRNLQFYERVIGLRFVKKTV